MSICVNEEYLRLKKLFDGVEDTKNELVDELLKKAAFLKAELDGLEEKIKKYGSIEVSNKGNTRESIYYKTYLTSVSIYQGIIRTLNSIMGTGVSEDDDSFDEFIKKATGGTEWTKYIVRFVIMEL